MSRGRLIFPFVVELHRADPRGGAIDPGLDHDFKEPALVDRDDDGLPDRLRRELPAVRVPAQVEADARSDDLRMFGSGNSPTLRVGLVLHFEDLERLGLVDADGEPLIRVGDRVGALYLTSGELAWRIRNPPGLYVIEVRALGFGLPHRAPRRNLLLLVCESRATGAPRGGL